MPRLGKIAIKNSILAVGSLFWIFFIDPVDLELDQFLFLLWLVSPFAGFLIVSLLTERFSSIRHVPTIGLVIAILMFAFRLMCYVGVATDRSSTVGLLFLFEPFWLWVGAFPIYGVSVLIAWSDNRQSRGDAA